MEILVTHLTRMKGSCVCVAGIDLASGKDVRPVLDNAPLGADLLVPNGGPIDIGAVIEVGTTWPRPVRPEIEDHIFDLRLLRSTDALMPARTFWAKLNARARGSLNELFGPDLHSRSGGMVVEIGRGAASLGCWRPKAVPTLVTEVRGGKPHIRMRVSIPFGELDLSLTDLRFWSTSTTPATPISHRVASAHTEFKSGREFVLCMGLTRSFAPENSHGGQVHWLQVNNIHFKDEVFPLAGPVPKWAEP